MLASAIVYSGVFAIPSVPMRSSTGTRSSGRPASIDTPDAPRPRLCPARDVPVAREPDPGRPGPAAASPRRLGRADGSSVRRSRASSRMGAANVRGTMRTLEQRVETSCLRAHGLRRSRLCVGRLTSRDASWSLPQDGSIMFETGRRLRRRDRGTLA